MNLTQPQMSAHDERTWKLYEACSNADARVGQAQNWVDSIAKRAAKFPEGYDATITMPKAQESLTKATANRDKAVKALDDHEKNYEGWARFWCVPNGHIHKSRSCSTCYVTTKFYLAHEVSGMDEKAAVEAQGPRLCTVCFPSAPVDWTNGLDKAAEERKASKCQADPYDYKDASDPRRVYRYATCNKCNGRPSLTSTGKMRSHKPGA